MSQSYNRRGWLRRVVVGRCRDGRVCPADRICDEVHGACISQAQLDECHDVADGDDGDELVDAADPDCPS